MDKDTKILLMAVVIILVALVSFNFSDLTGKVAKSSATTLTVAPTVISFGLHDTAKMLTIKISPQKGGIDKTLKMYRVKTGGKDLTMASETVKVCNRDICYDDVTISYRLNAGLGKGRYYFIAEDRKSNEVGRSNIFEIR